MQRFPDPSDRRATVVGITDAGRQIMANARSVIDELLEAAWARHVTDEEASVVVAVMDRVLENHHSQGSLISRRSS